MTKSNYNINCGFAKNNLIYAKNKKKKAAFKGVNAAKVISVAENYKPSVPFDQYLGFVTALVSSIGFAVGGSGLMYDFLHKNKEKISPEGLKNETLAVYKKQSSFYKEFLNQDDGVFVKFQESIKKIKEKSDAGNKPVKKEKGIGDIEPESKFGKIGLIFAKIGIAFSGLAGIFNGIAMRVPLMSAGEGLNVAASPIINTSTGYGLFSIALASIFAGRALENDPALKLNPTILKSKETFGEKTSYVMGNMWNSIKEVGRSTKKVFGNLFNLLNPDKAKAAAAFLKENIINIRSSSIVFNEKILADGRTVTEAMMKSPPYRMHTASAILALGGVILTAAGLLNHEKGKKVGFKTSETGGALDNISLSYSGLEKMAMGKTAAGVPLAVSGVTILSGTPNAEKDYGRALQWIGCGALFITFVVERGIGIKKALQHAKELTTKRLTEEGSDLIRQWEIRLTEGMDPKILKKHMGNLYKMLHGEGKVREEARKALTYSSDARPLVELVDKMTGKTGSGYFRATNSREGIDIEQELNKSLAEAGLGGFKARLVTEGKPADILPGILRENIKKFGENYKKQARAIMQDSPEEIRQIAGPILREANYI